MPTRLSLEELEETPRWVWDEEPARQLLLEFLGNRQAPGTQRLLAAELAGEGVVMNDEVAAALLRVASSPEEEEELRGQAAISLGPALEDADTMGYDEDPYAEPTISERVFEEIQSTLRGLFLDAGQPRELRRTVLEAAVHAPQEWHREALLTAYASDDPAWKLTAVFGMGYVPGLDDKIVDALDNPDPNTRYHAVCAAGAWGVKAAEPQVRALLDSTTEKELLLAAIEAVASINPGETPAILADLAESEDEDVAGAVFEALAMAECDPEDQDDDNDEFF